MEITSFHFLLFVVGSLIVYYLLPHRGQNYWLLFISYVFYVAWAWQFALLLLLSTVFHFSLAKYLRRNGQGRAALLWLGIGANIGLFLIFKASSFYFDRLIRLFDQFGIQSGLGGLEIILPIGLSYYVLQNISYIVDVYRGQFTAASNFVDFALYLAYFPKLIAGPIERARLFLPKLASPRLVDDEVLTRSITLIVVGAVRKLLIADLLSFYIPWEFIGDQSVFSRIELLGWLVIYAFALYNDFAGYTSIVRGVSGLFGIELSSNFNTPYFSRSFTEFWTRWHITLSQWLRDYIFFPLSRLTARRFPNRKGWQNLVIPPLITMLVSGIWHGPNWQMLIWGGMHALFLIGERIWNLWQPTSSKEPAIRWQGWAANAVVFLLVMLAWVPFSMRLSYAAGFWDQMIMGTTTGLRDYRLIYSLLVLIPALCLDVVQYNKPEELWFLQRRRFVRATLLATSILLILIVSQSGSGQPFIYQGF